MKSELCVLIVEDSSDDAQLIIHDLKRKGFTITWERVQSAQELRTALNHRTWDIVLSDYSMPQFNAIDALKIIKETDPDLPCIIISGTIGEETAVTAMQAGAQDFFVKGRLARLSSAIQRQLTEAENIRKRRKAERDLRASEQRLAKEREKALEQERAAREKIESLYLEAQEANRLKEEFLTNLSHELRTPMVAITGWAELLAKGECSADDYPVAFSAIYRSAKVQNKLINDLIDLSRIITGKFNIEKKPVDMEILARTVLESFRPAAEAKSLELKILSTAPVDGFVAGDQESLQRVLSNLLENAIKFTPIGGRILLEIRYAGTTVELSVNDTGEGIAPVFLPHIFNLFRQANGSLTRPHGGLGLGLAIVRYLTELHGGQVEAKSEGLGKGAKLVVRLPWITKREFAIGAAPG